MKASATQPGAPKIVDRATFQAELDALRVREKAHTREGDAIAAARRRLPMVEVDGATPLVGEHGAVILLDAFEGRRILIAYYFMWHAGAPAAEQCEGCTLYTAQVRELSFLHSRDVTYATICQGPYQESARYRDFMGWDLPWYSAPRAVARHRCWLDATWACFISFATCARATRCLKHIGRRGAASSRWATAMRCSTRPSMDGRRHGRTRLTAGRSGPTACTLTATTDDPLCNGRA